jgi:TetR/AcrR family transcriptional repressor of nem operon
VPRTKEFRPEEALDAAMHLFWLKGYGATSMRDLLDGMGIGRGSFYDTFGDKHALFLAALDRFEEARTSWVDEALEGSGMDGIEEVFRRTPAPSSAPGRPGRCRKTGTRGSSPASS